MSSIAQSKGNTTVIVCFSWLFTPTVDLSTIMSGSQVTGTPAVGLAAGSGDFEFQSDSKLHFHVSNQVEKLKV